MDKNILNFVAEFIGTFIFLGTIITVINSKESTMNFLKIGLALIVSISFFGGVSGGAFNPAVSLLLYLNNKISLPIMGIQIIAQICGALLAVFIFRYITSKGSNMINVQ